MNPLNVPPDVVRWVRDVFAKCNRRIAEKLSNNPNLPEESLDLTWIEHLSEYASPITLGSAWTVKIETHYLGGMRHFGSWEIADVGLLVFFRRKGAVVRSKVALLQSKRLYPKVGVVQEEDPIDFQIGFARIADPEKLAHSLAVQSQFDFTNQCRYGALTAQSEQVKAITAYERANKLSVHYQFYNPWQLPFTQRIPLGRFRRPAGKLTAGTRIVPSKSIHGLLGGFAPGRSPRAADLAGLCGPRFPLGWSLEHFVANLLLKCVEGTVFGDIADQNIQGLFYRRSGPIAAAIAVSIETPE